MVLWLLGVGRMLSYRRAMDSRDHDESNAYLYDSIRPLRVKGASVEVRQAFNFGRL